MPGSWKFNQVFTNSDTPSQNSSFATRQVLEGDILSAVEFDPTGEFLATGDKGGQVCVFQRTAPSKAEVIEVEEEETVTGKKRGTKSFAEQAAQPIKFKGFVEFQSHHPGFDYLKSLEIEEKINQIKWCNRTANSLLLLSTNDKTIKLWKVSMRNQLTCVSTLAKPKVRNPTSSRDLSLPRLIRTDKKHVVYKEARTYADAHTYHINSVSVSSDGINFISADDLRIYLWDINRSHKYNIVDMKPDNMEDLTEVITSAAYHPINSQLFMFSSSCGQLKLGDLRRGAVCTEFKSFFEPDSDPSKPFFSEIVASISDIKFSRDGRFAISRDYLRVRVWDLKMPHKAVHNIAVNSNLQGKLIELYENDSIFDKFEISLSPNGKQFVTGSYNGNFHIYDIDGTLNTTLKAQKYQGAGGNRYGNEALDVGRKVLHTSWHPTDNTVAITCHDSVYLYSKQ
mmetsp:Transcript_48003/g.71138  ORF Transcript_48003/g.71138 Transcript_48003/m.71138 type:complete len:453 (-) Transcript_48003:246-1604(-)